VTDAPVTIITAAGQGMGAAIARKLADADHRLVLTSNGGGAEQVARDLPSAVAVTGSVADPEHLAAVVGTAVEHFGRIDAVVNNTGHAAKGDLLELTDEDWHHGLDLLLLNVVRMTRLVTPIMQEQGGGAFVNISTFSAFEPSLKFPISSAIRAGLGSFIKLYAESYGADGIRINNLLPGFIDSYPESSDNLAAIPMDRYGRVEEIASVAAFLVSDASSYVTGQNLRVDGGLARSV
jgi:NAD(P)-dependent dehydrogenase (short-subunit alcohol dehydrogenase family)